MSRVKIEGNASGTGTLTISAPATNTDRSITLPDSAGEIITSSTISSNMPTGSVLQVVYGTDNTAVTTTSTTPQDTGLSVDITPSSTSSKIFVIYTGVGDNMASGRSFACTLFRDSTSLYGGNGLSRVYSASSRTLADVSGSTLDSPSTTSTITYSVKFFTGQSGEVRWYGSNHSTIIAMEIAG